MKLPLLVLLLSLPLAAEEVPSILAMKSAATAFLGSLDEAQRAKASFRFSAEARENFRFTPQTRTGLPLKEMNEDQRAAAMKLLDAALSDKGRLKAMRIILLESVLAVIEKRPEYRDSGRYYLPNCARSPRWNPSECWRAKCPERRKRPCLISAERALPTARKGPRRALICNRFHRSLSVFHGSPFLQIIDAAASIICARWLRMAVTV